MMRKQWLSILSILVVILLASACTEGEIGAWDIPNNEVRDGGVGKDGIPAIDNPSFIDVSEVSFLNDNDLVVAFKSGNEVHAYPHIILDWHEIINDKVSNDAIALTYCPLTGTAIGWDRNINGTETTFGVSGLLYNSNLIPYDRETDSNWSQIGLDCVNGNLRGEKARLLPIVETTWATFKAMFPNGKVVSTSTGVNRPYGNYPYGDYRTNNDFIIFSVNPMDDRLPSKDRVLGIVANEKAKVYQFKEFELGTTVIEDNFEGQSIVVVGDKDRNFIAAYETIAADGTVLTFSPITTNEVAVMVDQEGNKWNIFGEAIEGDRTGERLPSTNSFIGYWFSFGAFYPDAEIYE